MNHELILVANATRARLFTRESAQDPLVPLETIEQPEGRLKTSELADDHTGHRRNDNRPGGVDFAPRLDPRKKKHLAFARELSQRIDTALHDGAHHVTVFSSCPFLGELKGELSPTAKKALRAAVDADLTSLGLTELEQRIAHELHEEQH